MSAYTRPPGYIDEIEVERLMNGDTTIPLYRSIPGHQCSPLSAETVTAIRRLANHGYSDSQISQRLHGRLSRDAVLKARHRYRIPNGLTGRLVNDRPPPITDQELDVLRGYHRQYERLRAAGLPITAYIREQDARYRGAMRRLRRAKTVGAVAA